MPSSLPTDANELSGSRSQPPSIQHTPITVVASPLPHSASISSAPPTHPASLTPHPSSTPSSGLLSPIPEDSKPVNRDSNVSLPDEARRYIANLESPLQSPGLTAAVSSDEPAQAQTGQGVNANKLSPSSSWRAGPRGGDESEFLDSDEVRDRVEEMEQQQPPSLVINRHDKPADTDDFPTTPSSHGPIHVHPPSHTQSASSHSTSNPGPYLPPASETVVTSQKDWQSQSDISMLSQSQSSLESTPLTPHQDIPFPESYLSPTKSTHGDGPNPTFRALPLIANDLKTTRIIVSHSSIRPNDRGKEVLSFEIEVDPGNGKELWKVEKLYSDVLGLDHRLRATVGKGISKKIATLPEGKLWRDHAPAKSDQRKVSKTHTHAFFRG